eukprot:gene7233-16904_t
MVKYGPKTQLEWENMDMPQCRGAICTRQTKRDNFPIDLE